MIKKRLALVRLSACSEIFSMENQLTRGKQIKQGIMSNYGYILQELMDDMKEGKEAMKDMRKEEPSDRHGDRCITEVVRKITS